MNKLLAVIKREYLQRIRTKFFVIMTILGPLMLVVFTIVPGLLFSLKSGDTKIAIIDQTANANLYTPVRNALIRGRDDEDEDDGPPDLSSSLDKNPKDRMETAAKSMRGSFLVEAAPLAGRSLE